MAVIASARARTMYDEWTFTDVGGDSSDATGVNGDQDNEHARNSGAAYLFVRIGSTWAQQAYLKASNTGASDQFGTSVDVSGDLVVVGAAGEASTATGINPGGGAQADNSAYAAGAVYVFTMAITPCAEDDTLYVPVGAALSIPVASLLANDAHAMGLPLSFAGHDALTTHGAIVTHDGPPTTVLRFPSPPPLPPGAEDTFTYRITDGTRAAIGTVHLIPVDLPAPPPNGLSAATGRPGSLLGLPFNAPAAGTYALERKICPIPGAESVEGVWTEVERVTVAGPGVVTFTDAMLPGAAWYRVRAVP